VKLWLLAATVVFGCAGNAVPQPQPTFASDIAPIVYQTCAPCHRPGEAAPFPLLSYRDVKAHARQIVEATGKRYMPPWPPQPGYGEFKDTRRLTVRKFS
jgi:mono/diheme cytochrome c family protein